MIKAKTLQWKEIEPEVFEEWAYNATIAVLTLNKEPAYYQVSKVAGCIGCDLWAGNQAINVKCWLRSLEEGKHKCQEHYNNLVSENAQD